MPSVRLVPRLTRRRHIVPRTIRGTRVAVIVGLLAIAVNVGGCEGGDENTPEGVLKAFGQAAADGDGERACGLLTGPAQRSLAFGSSCASSVNEVSFGEEEKKALRSVTIRNIHVTGNRATVQDRDISSEEGQLPPETDTDPTVLERIDGKWRITDPG